MSATLLNEYAIVWYAPGGFLTLKEDRLSIQRESGPSTTRSSNCRSRVVRKQVASHSRMQTRRYTGSGSDVAVSWSAMQRMTRFKYFEVFFDVTTAARNRVARRMGSSTMTATRCDMLIYTGATGELVAWHSGRSSVSDWRTFPVLRSTCS